MEKKTLYCFVYDTKENKCYTDHYEASELNGDYFIHDDNDETILVQGYKIDKPQTYAGDIYLYTFINDANRAMELTEKYVKDIVDAAYNELAKAKDILKRVIIKRCEVKEKFPDGVVNHPSNEINA